MDAITKMGYASFSPFKDNKQNVIHSNKITMHDTRTPIMAYPDGDMPTMMFPGKNYVFPNSKSVTERKMQGGGMVNQGQGQGQVNPIMGKENDLLSFHLSKLNKPDQTKFLEMYRGMVQGEKEQVLERIIQDFEGPRDNFDMGEMNQTQSQPTARKGMRYQDGGTPTNLGGAPGYVTPDGRYYEPESPFSKYNQSDSMGPNPVVSNKEAVKMADKAQVHINKIKDDQAGIARIQQNLIGEGYKLPKSTQKKGELDGVMGRETQSVIDQFIADRTGYNVQTGMSREEARADAWATVLSGSGIISSKFKRFAPLADIPKAQTKVIDKAANINTILPVKTKMAIDDSKNYSPVKLSNITDSEGSPRKFTTTDSSTKRNIYTPQIKVNREASMGPLKFFKGMPVVEATPEYLILKDVRNGKNVIWDLKKKQYQYTNLK